MGVAGTFAVLIWKHLVLACEASCPGGSVEREHNVIVRHRHLKPCAKTT